MSASPADLPLDTTLEVETPEHVRFGYRLAGPARRTAAYVIDLIVRGVLLIGLTIAFSLLSLASSGTFGGLEIGGALVAFFVVEWGYYVVSEVAMNGSSLGKKTFRLRVVQADGLPITFTDSLLRNLLRAADLLPMFYAIGLTSMSLDRKFRRLGDFVAGTIVIHEPLLVERAVPATSEARGSRGDYDLPARPRLTREELRALDLFSRRRRRLSHDRAEELAEIVAPLFADRFSTQYDSATRFLEVLYEKAHGRAR